MARIEEIRQRVYARPVRDWADGLVTVDLPDFETLCGMAARAEAAMAILRRFEEIEEENDGLLVSSRADGCPYCGGEVRMYGDEVAGPECADIKHEPDCPVMQAKRLMEGRGD